jgi:hypothetical protein
VLGKIFAAARDEVIGEWSRLHNDKLLDFYSSPNIFRVIKPIGMRWAGRIACNVVKRGAYRVLVRKPRERTTWKTQAKMGG